MATPKPTRGVAVELDRKRYLRFPLAALRQIDENTDLVTILYLGLRHEDEDLTEDDVGEIIDLEMLKDLTEPLRKATAGLINVDALFGIENGDAPEEGGAEGNSMTGGSGSGPEPEPPE